MCWNNYTEVGYLALIAELSSCAAVKYVFGREIAGTGTPHIQGYIEWPNPKDFNGVRALQPQSHWLPARRPRKWNVAYCKKEGNFDSNFPASKKERCLNMYCSVEWKPWQQELIDMMAAPAPRRKIVWRWKPLGETGKSFLDYYLYLKFDAVLAMGKRTDVLHQVVTWQEEHQDRDPKLVLLDLDRTGMEYLNYSTIERLKDMYGASGKYKSTTFYFEHCPHVIVFSNEEPNYNKMSRDRWDVKQID